MRREVFAGGGCSWSIMSATKPAKKTPANTRTKTRAEVDAWIDANTIVLGNTILIGKLAERNAAPAAPSAWVDFSRLFCSKSAASAFAEQARILRDAQDGVSATHWTAWDTVLRAAEAAGEAIEASKTENGAAAPSEGV